MSKNIKEKSSFWKKLGLGKHKASSASLGAAYQKQDKNDTASVKSQRRQSNNSHHSQHKRQQSVPIVDTPPPIPHGNIPKQSNNEQHVNHNEPFDSLPKSNNDTLTPTEPSQSEQETRLQEEIDNLKQQLEQEKTVIGTLKKQKEAITKDLDYLGSTVDELYAEKSDLLQQLEDEKSKNERQLEDLNLLMDKMKANADNARDKSFAVDQYKLDFENHMAEYQEEKKEWAEKMTSKDREIRRLNIELDTTKDQLDMIKITMEQLIQSHAAELSRVTASAAAAAESRNTQSASYTMNTPNGSPQFQPKKEEDLSCSPIPSNLPMPSTSTTSTQQSNDSDYQTKKPKEDIDSQLMKLTKEKEKLQSSYSKIPLSGGGPQSRRRKEELEAMLDQVDSQLSKVKQRIRRS